MSILEVSNSPFLIHLGWEYTLQNDNIEVQMSTDFLKYATNRSKLKATGVQIDADGRCVYPKFSWQLMTSYEPSPLNHGLQLGFQIQPWLIQKILEYRIQTTLPMLRAKTKMTKKAFFGYTWLSLGIITQLEHFSYRSGRTLNIPKWWFGH